MKFNQYLWNLYKNSPEGKSAISSFSYRKEWIEEERLFEKYNPKIKDGFNPEMICGILEDFWCYKVSEYESIGLKSLDDAGKLYEEIISTGLTIESEQILKIDDFDRMLEHIPFLSMELNYLFREYFFPYIYIDDFYQLTRLADYFEIELPPVPKKSDYKARCMYYWELCRVFYMFRIENSLSPDELSAFIYDYVPNVLGVEEKGKMPKASTAWFIGGPIKGYGTHWTTGFWQSNKDTKRGDILIHYETSPVCAITCLWIAQTNGVVDPFFHYYTHTYIGDKIDIPNISLKELKADEYFSSHALVRKNFQGVNGWPAIGKDYVELMRMIEAKGFDTSVLPHIYTPSLPEGIIIKNERDVETNLLEPLLHSMGWYEYKNYIRQLPIHAGRGHRIFPDYALHYNNKPEEENAKVLIEAKYHMKSNQEIENAFLQAFSYAKLLLSSVIVLCDKECILTYEGKEGFSRNCYKKYYWEDMKNPDLYNELKNLIKF